MPSPLSCRAVPRRDKAYLALVAAAIGFLGGCASQDDGPGPAAEMAELSLRVQWGAQEAAGIQRGALVASARSVSIGVNDAGVSQYLNSPNTTLSLAAPIGLDTFDFRVFDEQNGQGNVVSQGSLTQEIAPNVANVLAVTLNGVVRSLKIALTNPNPPAGTAAAIGITVSALDADGNVIAGPADYDKPIVLTINDPAGSGMLVLSNNLLQGPSSTALVTYQGGTLASATVVASAAGVTSVSAALVPKPTTFEYAIPTAGRRPQWIAAGSDGNMWFTESPGNAVARITPAGVVTEFTVPTASANPQQIIGASDGNLWFTEFSSNKIARLTTGGVFTEFSTLFAPPPNDSPMGLVDRLDGNIWYVANGTSRIGFLSYNGSVAGETSVPTASSAPFGIATAPDNNLYYTESGTDKIGRITNLFTAQSEITLTAGTQPNQIVRGPDGNLWFTESGTSKIGRLSPNSFSVTGEFPTLTPGATPTGITVGADGALWFTESSQDRIGRITTGGTVTEFPIASAGTAPRGIAVGPDGSLWFCAPGSGLNPGRIGRLVY